MSLVSANKTTSRGQYLLKSFSWCLVAYVVAFAGAYLTVDFFDGSMSVLWLTFLADIIATLIIFLFSSIFRNSSFYDPYWSVAPPVVAIYWTSVSEEGFSFKNNLILIAIFLWAIRLTLNWARGWKGLNHEDWRYGELRMKTKTLFPVVNFSGIHLFPTVMVFLAMLPAYFAINSHSNNSSVLKWIALFVCILATIIELIADEQQKIWRRRPSDRNQFYRAGLWNYSRHPNYFGEVLFWWGIYLFVLASDTSHWWTIAGAIVMTIMFLFISIPLMEKHMLEKRPSYIDYQKKVPALIPWVTKQ